MAIRSKLYPQLSKKTPEEINALKVRFGQPEHLFRPSQHLFAFMGAGILLIASSVLPKTEQRFYALGASTAVSVTALLVSIRKDQEAQLLNHLENSLTASQIERMAVLRTLLWLANSDGQISENEIKILYELAAQMEIDLFDPADESEKLPRELRILLKDIHSKEAKEFLVKQIIHLCYSDSYYDAFERKALFDIAEGLQETPIFIECLEKDYAQEYLETTVQAQENVLLQGAKKAQQPHDWDWRTAGVVSGLAVGGGLLLFLTGGMAAPAVGGLIGSQVMGLSGAAAVSAGLAAIGGGSLAAGGMGMAGGSLIVSSIFGLGGALAAAGSGANLTGDLEEFQFVSAAPNRKACHNIICIHGFLQQGIDCQTEWQAVTDFYPHSIVFGLNWESKKLQDITNILQNGAVNVALSQAVGFIAKSGLKAAGGMFAWPAGILSAFKLIDNPWAVARNRSEKAGIALGKIIEQMKSPVSLLGYSLGSRVIIHALEYLEKKNVSGKVFDVYILAGAVGSDSIFFKSRNLKRVVTNHIYNVYSERDAILSYIYRTAEWGNFPIGLKFLEHPEVINIDGTGFVSDHMDYPKKLKLILQACEKAVKS
jgi:hypothetical protein